MRETKGWGKVFKFTFLQMIKTKSFIISTIVILLIINGLIASLVFIPALIDGNGSIGGGSSDEIGSASYDRTIYVSDTTDLPQKFDFSTLSKLGLSFVESEKSFDELVSEIKDSSEAVLALGIGRNNDGSFFAQLARPYSEEIVGRDESDRILDLITDSMKEQKLKMAGVSDSDISLAMAGISYDSILAGGSSNEFEKVVKTILPMVLSLVLFILIFQYGAMVAQSIATEKTSRVMELLLTSVRPFAVIIGKILAMGTVALLQLVLFGATTGITGFISFKAIMPDITSSIGSAGEIPSGAFAEIQEGLSSAFSGFNALSVVLFFVIFILGFLFYALIAGLIGASVSRVEDLAQAMQPLSLIGVLGFYLSYMPSAFDIESDKANIVVIISRYLPISSPFSLPSAIITGDMSTGEALIAVLVLAACVAVFAWVVAKVYETLILHNGNRIKFFQIFKMAGAKKS